MMQEFVGQISKNMKEAMKGIHTAMPGTIVSFDSSTGLATVSPSMKFKKPDGTTIDYPAITGVPVIIPQAMGQGATIAFPIKAGDGCLIVVAEQSIDFWLYGQETDTDLDFDLSNAICIPGLFPSANAVLAEACNSNSVIVDVRGTRLSVRNGSVEIAGNLVVSGTITAAGDVIGSGVSLASHIHTGDSGGSTSAPN